MTAREAWLRLFELPRNKGRRQPKLATGSLLSLQDQKTLYLEEKGEEALARQLLSDSEREADDQAL